MRNQKVIKLEQAVRTLEYAKYQINEALGYSDAYYLTATEIDKVIQDIEHDIARLITTFG